MKKLLCLFLALVFAFSIYFSISQNLVNTMDETTAFAYGPPVPPPEKPNNIGL